MLGGSLALYASWSATSSFMPGVSSSPHGAANEVTSAPFSAPATGVGGESTLPSLVISCSRNDGPCRIHCGLKPSVAAVPTIGPVADGSAVTTTASAPAALSFCTWAVNDVSPALNDCCPASANPSADLAALNPRSPSAPY